MKAGFWSKALFSAMMVLAITLSAAQTGQAQSRSIKSPGGDVVFDPVTGALAFVGTGANQAIPSQLANPGLQPDTQNASAFISAYAPQMGLQDVAADLALAKTSKGSDSRTTIRYHQLYKGQDFAESKREHPACYDCRPGRCGCGYGHRKIRKRARSGPDGRYARTTNLRCTFVAG